MTTRFVLSLAVGLFSLLLGCVALWHNPRRRLNRSFSFYMFAVAVWNVAPGFVVGSLPHDQALFLYRLIQMALPLTTYFLIRFVQDFAGVYDEPFSRRLRAAGLALVAILLPFYPTSLVIRDFRSIPNEGLIFAREAGPFFLVNIAVFLLLFLMASVIAFWNLRRSSGIKRNQMLFLLFGMALGIVSVVSYFVSFIVRDLPVYFFLQAAMNFCFAYAIFKYRLFEFGFFLRRLSIYAGVYVGLASLPLFIYFPFRDFLPTGDRLWSALAVLTAVYGGLAALAPTIAATLRTRAEASRWSHLRHQLNVVRASAERLADESHIALSAISERVADVLTEFYWHRLETRLRFVFVAVRNQSGKLATAVFPRHDVSETVLVEFLDCLGRLPPEALENPFSSLDVDDRFIRDGKGNREDLTTVSRYLRNNGIEICCPCLHDGRIYGTVLLGPKERGIFWEEELATLQLAASHVATAVRRAELIERTRELRDLDQLKKELISNITHEFKVPLANVDNAIHVLLEDLEHRRNDAATTREFLMMIRDNTERLSFFIQDLLSVAEIEQTRIAIDPTPSRLADAVAEAAQAVTLQAKEKKIDLRLTVPPDLVLNLDRDKIVRILTNLLSNAVKFTDAGSVDVSTEIGDSWVRVRVDDTGRGFDPRYADSIFHKFFRIPDAKRRHYKGTGLGLTIAKGWTEAHGGKIWAESAGMGKGARFVIELPRESDSLGGG